MIDALADIIFGRVTTVLGLTAEQWQIFAIILSGVSTMISAIMIVSLVLGARSLREGTSAKDSAILIWAIGEISEIRPLMNEIRDHRGEPEWFDANRDKVLRVMRTLQMISFMAMDGVISRDRIAKMWGKSFVEQWNSLYLFVADFRERNGEPRHLAMGAYYARNFEGFANYCCDYLNAGFRLNMSIELIPLDTTPTAVARQHSEMEE